MQTNCLWISSFLFRCCCHAAISRFFCVRDVFALFQQILLHLILVLWFATMSFYAIIVVFWWLIFSDALAIFIVCLWIKNPRIFQIINKIITLSFLTPEKLFLFSFEIFGVHFDDCTLVILEKLEIFLNESKISKPPWFKLILY